MLKTIKKKIRKSMILAALLVGIAITISTTLMFYLNTMSSTEQMLTETARAYAMNIKNETDLIKTDLKITAANNVVSDANEKDEARRGRLDMLQNNVFKKLEIANSKGITLGKEDVKEQEFFVKALGGIANISSPVVDKATNTVSLVAARNIGRDVLFATIDYSYFSNIISSINVGKVGYGIVVDSKGVVVAHPDAQVVKNMTNYIELAKDDKTYAALASVVQEMLEKKTGILSGNVNGKNMMIAYTPIVTTEGWALAIVLPYSAFISSFYFSMLIAGVLLILLLIAVLIMSSPMSSGIAKPVIAATQRIKQLSEGDLTSPVPSMVSQDETGLLLSSLSVTIDTVNDYISEISSVLSNLAQGDLRQKCENDYKGDFVPLKEALNTIITALHDAFTNISIAATQVDQGAGQISSGAQEISQSTMEQAATIQQLSASLNNISTGVQGIAKNAEKASVLSQKSRENVILGNTQMSDMLGAMNEIDESSNQISKIIKVINDIAFQTNILALNAAVEAARAGNAGKGFAVVADEVRNLASKSADAVKDTTELIERSITTVQKGAKIARSTAESLEQIAQQAEGVNKIIEEIHDETTHQATAVLQISQGMEQMSVVVQSNSATAEQSAASSVEMNSQAQRLNELLVKFQL